MNSPQIDKRSAMQELTSTAAKNEPFPTSSSWPGQNTKGVREKLGLVSYKGASFWPVSC